MGGAFGAALFILITFDCVVSFSVHKDTIVAIATPEGNGGGAMVRLSGSEALNIAAKILKPGFGAEIKSHQAVYGILEWPEGGISPNEALNGAIDQVIALPMLTPNSFTGEDTVEFFCHGGTVVSRQVVSACRLAGARPATAGEFTRRAFLNGKLSLDQAEAVADLIHAESDMAARAAIRQLLGGLSGELVAIEKPLLSLLARLEGGLEFLEEDHAGVDSAEIARVLSESMGGITRLLDLAPAGRLLRDGIHVVLTGAPNVGKSSLFNELVQSDRAIVDEEAGTTRDVVAARVVHHGQVFVFHDTAGLRETPGRIEGKGIERTHRAVREADIVLSLSLVGAPAESPPELGEEFSAAAMISVCTKCDLFPEKAAHQNRDDVSVYTSSISGQGVDSLWKELESCVQKYELDKAISLGVVINERHRFKLENSLHELNQLLEEISQPNSIIGDEVVGTLLASILAQLGEISGRVFSEQILESVFSRFCVGK